MLSFATPQSTLFTEQRVDFSTIVPSGFGTCDSAIVVPENKTLHVFDLKYGKGVVVDAKENSQGMLYAIGLYNKIWKTHPCDLFSIHICQPRRNHWDRYDITFQELKDFSLWVKTQAKIALSPQATRIAGEKQCQWCLAKGDCDERHKFDGKTKKNDVFEMFDDISDE